MISNLCQNGHVQISILGSNMSITTVYESGCLTVSAEYNNNRYKQRLRPEDFRMKSKQSLLFVKLLIESEELKEQSVWFMEGDQIMLDNVLIGQAATDKMTKLHKQTSTEHKGIAIMIQYDGFMFLIQLPMLIKKVRQPIEIVHFKDPHQILNEEIVNFYEQQFMMTERLCNI